MSQKISNKMAPSSLRALRKHLLRLTSSSAPVSEAITALLITPLKGLPTGCSVALAFGLRILRPRLDRTEQRNRILSPKLQSAKEALAIGIPHPEKDAVIREGGGGGERFTVAATTGVGDQEPNLGTEEVIGWGNVESRGDK